MNSSGAHFEVMVCSCKILNRTGSPSQDDLFFLKYNLSKDPWTELTQYATTKRNSPKLIEIIEQLGKTLGPLAIEWPQSEIYSSAHYDFHLTMKKSNKRKLSDS